MIVQSSVDTENRNSYACSMDIDDGDEFYELQDNNVYFYHCNSNAENDAYDNMYSFVQSFIKSINRLNSNQTTLTAIYLLCKNLIEKLGQFFIKQLRKNSEVSAPHVLEMSTKFVLERLSE